MGVLFGLGAPQKQLYSYRTPKSTQNHWSFEPRKEDDVKELAVSWLTIRVHILPNCLWNSGPLWPVDFCTVVCNMVQLHGSRVHTAVQNVAKGIEGCQNFGPHQDFQDPPIMCRRSCNRQPQHQHQVALSQRPKQHTTTNCQRKNTYASIILPPPLFEVCWG